jgi:hypothetical protein
MSNGHNPRYSVTNGVNDFEMVLGGGPKFAVVGITFQRVSVGMIPNLFKSLLNFIDELCDNLGGVGSTEKKIGPAIKLPIRRFDQNGFRVAHERRFVVNLPANVPARTD